MFAMQDLIMEGLDLEEYRFMKVSLLQKIPQLILGSLDMDIKKLYRNLQLL
jgi:hypothetical protein